MAAALGLNVGPGCAASDQPQVAEAPAPVSAAAPDPGVFDYFGGLDLDPSVPTPAQVMGHGVGERFTRHGELEDYVRTLAATSDRVSAKTYGRSHQNRRLWRMVITSPENQDRLDNILAANLELTDPRRTERARARRIAQQNPAIVWFSFNVHGNEASCTEAAVQLAYSLAAARSREVRDILTDVVLVIDPVVNPDGRARYINFFENAASPGGGNASPLASEHHEPWPGGRTNHYLFDLNRDWVWLTQPESRARVAEYRKFMPQLHVDYHEQGHRSPYFFGAGEDPWNLNIPDSTREWAELYGRANAEVFDREGLVYATRERFDYLYPGYGKVLPCYQGAVGLLCEKGGHGFAGLAIEISDQYTLTLEERARHHFLTAMSYLETTAANRQAQLARFAQFFSESMSLGDDGGPSAFVISADNDELALWRLWDVCHRQGIEIERLDRAEPMTRLRSYQTGREIGRTELPAGAWLVRVNQPRGRLVRALFERDVQLTDAETYDITGWSIPVALGLDAQWTTEAPPTRTTRLESLPFPIGQVTGGGDVAILIDAAQSGFPEAAGLVRTRDVFARRAGAAIALEDRRFAMGSLIIHRSRNQARDLDALIDEITARGVDVHLAGTGMTTEGHVLGANDNWLYANPAVALARGDGTSSYSFGQTWWWLDHEGKLGVTPIDVDELADADLHDINVLVIPETTGAFSGELGERGFAKISEWVKSGGVVVAINDAAHMANEKLLEIEPEKDEDEEPDEEPSDERPPLSELTYAEREARRIEDNTPGPMVKLAVDLTHPLAAGAREWVGVVKRDARRLQVKDEGYVVARYEESPRLSGHMSERNRAEIAGKPAITAHRLGRGMVICFADDPTIRGFQHGAMRLLYNAVVYGPSL